MTAYFVRRLIGGFLTLLASTFLFYSLLIYPPGSLHSSYELFRSGHSGGEYIWTFRYMVEYYGVLKPWPSSYLGWIFDPDDTEKLDIRSQLVVPNGVDIKIGELRFRGSGLLTGDLGESVSPWRGIPVLDAYGIEPIRLYSLCFSALSFFMLIAALQRRGRTHPCRSSRIPPNARWRPAELWATS